MSGSSMSYNHVSFIGARVAGAPTYTPAHIGAQGKPVRQMATINVYQNINGKPSKFRLTAWGKMADVVARSCAAGKELMIEAEAHSYKGKIPVPNQAQGAPLTFVLGADNQPIMIEKTGFVLRRILFGADSDKQVAYEIQNGMRPPLWNVSGHPDQAAWKNVCNQRNAVQFTPGQTQFGYAQIRLPAGQLVDPATFNKPAADGTSVVGTAQYVAPGPVQANGFQGVQAMNADGTPVIVNGAQMGYAAPIDPVQGNTQVVAGNGFKM